MTNVPELVHQPPYSNLCGQACVATLAGVDLDVACVAVGRRGKTSTRDVVRGLRALGVACADRLERVSRWTPLPPRCMARVRWPDRRSHWIIFWDGVLLDPASSYAPPERWPIDARITSYLEIYGRDPDAPEGDGTA